MWIDFDELIRLLSAIFALALFIISLIAYLRERRNKLLIVSAAFLVFCIKAFLKISDIFFPEKPGSIDNLVNILDFLMLFLFFLAVIIKDRMQNDS